MEMMEISTLTANKAAFLYMKGSEKTSGLYLEMMFLYLVNTDIKASFSPVYSQFWDRVMHKLSCWCSRETHFCLFIISKDQ